MSERPAIERAARAEAEARFVGVDLHEPGVEHALRDAFVYGAKWHAALPTRGERLDAISRDLDRTGAAWVAAGYPHDGPEWEAREAVFARLRAWNDREET